jgi:hypothetical protein
VPALLKNLFGLTIFLKHKQDGIDYEKSKKNNCPDSERKQVPKNQN